MLAEITAAWTAIKAASEGIKALLNTVTNAETKKAISGIQDSLLEVQAKLLAAQAEYQTLTEVKHDLERKLVEHEKWDAEKARYRLQEVAGGTFVYVLKPENADGEPIHWLCPNCFQRREKSILTKPTVDNLNYKCHRCSFDVQPKSSFSGDATGSWEEETWGV
jgi:hypothetical protein